MASFYRFHCTLGSYGAENAESISRVGYSARFEDIQTNNFQWNRFEAVFYRHGQSADFSINEWKFSPYVSGEYRIYPQIPPDSPEFVIRALDPHQHQFECKVYSNGLFKEAAEDFLNTIHLLCKFPNREYADSFYKLKKRKNSNSRIENEDLLPLLQNIKEFYDRYHNAENPDELFWGQLKDTYNEAVGDFIESLDSMRIE